MQRPARRLSPARASVPMRDYVPDGRLVAIGSSTGGVEALIAILTKFPANCPPTIISQHMPPTFTRSFAERLNKLCAPAVQEAEEGALVKPGQVFLCPGDMHLELGASMPPRIRLSNGEKVNGHRPSVDVMFASVLRCAGANAVGVILTGLGRDGADGLLALRQAGAETIGQDQASSVVYGMPKAAFEIGAVVRQLPLDRIAERVLAATHLSAPGKASAQNSAQRTSERSVEPATREPARGRAGTARARERMG
ncbi:MAG: hypothetical protein B7Z81_08835 [Acidocella sp. 20-61-6]|nr:MAG: hypothetical protein B7Z81_08835 [Acidocella sp. 20-61-6]